MRPLVASVIVLCALAVPGEAPAATVLIGPAVITSSSFDAVNCSGDPCYWEPAANIGVPSGSVNAQADGTITAWRLLGTGTGGGFVQLNVLHHNADGSVNATATSPHPDAYDGVTANPVSLPIGVGDTLGVTAVSANMPGAVAIVRGDSVAGAISGGYAVLGSPGTGWPNGSEYGSQVQVNATLEASPPAIGGVSPASAPAGTKVTLTGQHLAVATSVKMGGQDASIVLADNTAITVTAPDHPLGSADVQVTTAGGSSAVGAGTTFTYTDATGAPAATPTPEPAPMVLGSLSMTPSRFRAANLGGPIAAARIAAAPVGSAVSYAVSRAATVTFTVRRLRSGRRVGKRCVKPTRKLRRAAKCTRTTALTPTVTQSAQAGDNRFTFTGRLANKALPRGSYRLGAVAANADGKTSGSASAAFHIVR